MRAPAIFLTACLLSAASPAAARAAVTDTTRYVYYPVTVSGNTLGAAMTAASPISTGGVKYHGHTQWNVTWHFTSAPTGGGLCRISSVDTALTIVVTLPQLVSAPPDIVAVFNGYLPRLKKHEEGHVAIDRDAAAKIDSTIAGVSGVPCATIVTDTNRLATAALDAGNAKNDDYDAQTHHGRTQGAYLP